MFIAFLIVTAVLLFTHSAAELEGDPHADRRLVRNVIVAAALLRLAGWFLGIS